MHTAIDCQGFAGGFTLGMAQAGFNIIAKRENVGGFGVPIVADNMNIPDIEVGEPGTWSRRTADVVFGNPPCSGFSAFTQVSNRTAWKVKMGIEADINSCMMDLVSYAGDCLDVKIVIMESVQLAYTRGRPLMQLLRERMEEMSGQKFDLIHVMHNAASVGGASQRKRYFMVLARRDLNFGIEPPLFDLHSCPLMKDVIGDLDSLPEFTFEPQRYVDGPWSKYAERLRSKSGEVDGHMLRTTTETFGLRWISENGQWNGGEHVGHATRRAIEAVGLENVPARLKYKDGSGQVTNMFLSTHAYSPRKAHAHKMAPVMTGTGAEDCIHPTEPRTLTYREVARIMGFPDDWSLRTIETAKGGPSQNQKWLGKGISVPCGKWIGEWAKRALDGEPGDWRGELLAPNEYLIDVTNDFKAVYNDRTGEYGDHRSIKLRKEMDARTWGVPAVQ